MATQTNLQRYRIYRIPPKQGGFGPGPSSQSRVVEVDSSVTPPPGAEKVSGDEPLTDWTDVPAAPPIQGFPV